MKIAIQIARKLRAVQNVESQSIQNAMQNGVVSYSPHIAGNKPEH